MILDLSLYGFVQAALKSLKVLGWHIASDAVLIIGAWATDLTGQLKVQHPEYAIYGMAALAAVNTGLFLVGKWLTSVNPDKVSVPVAGELA